MQSLAIISAIISLGIAGYYCLLFMPIIRICKSYGVKLSKTAALLQLINIVLNLTVFAISVIFILL